MTRPVTDLQRTVAPFEVISDYIPSGDQPTAIADLARRIEAGEQDIVLLGATGTGKSATTAWLIEKLQRPTLVMAPNKTLAAQLANEFRELLPNNAVEYFVSYYDYYQPEAYIAQSDTYIEKDSSVNEEVERLRHSATNSLLTRRDVIVVASVSCIYGLGTPQEYVDRMVRLRVGQEYDRDQLLRRLVSIQYTRNDLAFTRGTFRVRGDTIEVFPVYEENPVRIEMFGDNPRVFAHVAETDGKIVGIALWFLIYSSWSGRPGLYLEDLFVTEAARGSGAGRALLVALASAAKALGCARMDWSVLDWNENAMAFYKALGARPTLG